MLGYFETNPKIINLNYDDGEDLQLSILLQLQKFDTVIIAVHDVKLKAVENFGITESLSQFLTKILALQKCELVFFGNPYALNTIKNLEKAESILITYQENKYTLDTAFRVITGQLKAEGILPVSINKNFTANVITSQ